ncbi:NlpC/P60 family protein [Polluticoccus soli]|uniref:NlpC/P60 family protein n=1 Tax=Polluticoccus soli TaxID=3034150 RepID=UPI0023E0B348|nr:NlpC/P60 family protein [Flavipsychrobacter sp. JY13-12]
MRYLTTVCTCASLTAFLMLASCTGSKQAGYSWHRKPQFIDSISLGGNYNSTVNTTVAKNNYKYDRWSNTYGNKGNNFTPKKYDPSVTNVLQVKYSDLLSVVPQAITNFPLYSFIDEWYGVRYRLGGNDKSGIDCSAFVQKLYENVFGMNLLRTAFEQFNSCTMAYEACELKEGDLVFFYTTTYTRRKGHVRATGRRISHVGVYLANDKFVHASTTQGVTISSLKESYWAHKFAGGGQIPKG